MFLFPASLYFANATYFQTQLLGAVDGSTPPCTTVVLDCAAISDSDYTGIETLRDILAHLKKSHIACRLARVDDKLRHNLTTAGLLEGKDAPQLFASVNEAAAFQEG